MGFPPPRQEISGGRRINGLRQNQTRTHLDRQGEPAEAGAAHPDRGPGQVAPRAASGTGKDDLFDNRLIFGDNLLALKALEQEFTGKIKCIYIDPPYNTGSAFTHYDDGVEHSLWLSLDARPAGDSAAACCVPDGSIWISIDDNEAHYLKVLMDEVFGRANFVATIMLGEDLHAEELREVLFGDARLRLGLCKGQEKWTLATT